MCGCSTQEKCRWRYVHLIEKEPGSACHGCAVQWSTTLAHYRQCEYDKDYPTAPGADALLPRLEFKDEHGMDFALPAGVVVSVAPDGPPDVVVEDAPEPSPAESVTAEEAAYKTSAATLARLFKARTRAATDMEAARATLAKRKEAYDSAIKEHEEADDLHRAQLEKLHAALTRNRQAISLAAASKGEAQKAAAKPSLGAQATDACQALFANIAVQIQANDGTFPIDLKAPDLVAINAFIDAAKKAMAGDAAPPPAGAGGTSAAAPVEAMGTLARLPATPVAAGALAAVAGTLALLPAAPDAAPARGRPAVQVAPRFRRSRARSEEQPQRVRSRSHGIGLDDSDGDAFDGFVADGVPLDNY